MIVVTLAVTGSRRGSRRLPVAANPGPAMSATRGPGGAQGRPSGSGADCAVIEGTLRSRSVGNGVTLAGLGRHQNPRRSGLDCREGIRVHASSVSHELCTIRGIRRHCDDPIGDSRSRRASRHDERNKPVKGARNRQRDCNARSQGTMVEVGDCREGMRSSQAIGMLRYVRIATLWMHLPTRS
jgi:hypothetical protein